MTHFKAIIFDCDGTLVDSEEFHYLAWQDAFQTYGYHLAKECYISHFLGQGDAGVIKIANDLLGWKCPFTLIQEKNLFFDRYQAAGIAPIAGTVAFVKRLFEQKERYNLKLAVASGARKNEILHNLKSLQIDHYFEIILSGCEDLSEYDDPEGTNKPKPYVYLKAAKMLGLNPKDCIAIEDSSVGVQAAVAAGCFTVAVPNPYTHTHDFSSAHMQLPSLDHLSIEAFLTTIREKQSNTKCTQ